MDDNLPIGGLFYNSMEKSEVSEEVPFIFTKAFHTSKEDPYHFLQSMKESAILAKNKFPHKHVVGVITSSNLRHQPFGEAPFTEIMNIYSEQAFALKEGGATLLFIKNISSVSHCRAAVLGARQTNLPVFISIVANSSMELESRASITSALIVSQCLGALGFCIATKDFEDALDCVKDLSPYARIPLYLNCDFSKTGAKELLEMERYCSPCVDISTLSEKQQEKMMKIFSKDSQSRFMYKDTQSLLVCTEYEPFFLDEMFEIGSSLDWEEFDEDEILELDNSGYDVIGVEISSENDVYTFMENAHLFTRPIAFRCDDPLLLEQVLMLYTGRAIIDSSRSEIEEDLLWEIARGYGALLR